MKFANDYLGGAKFKSAILKAHPNGFGAGFFTFVDGFGDALPIIDALAKTRRCPFIRVHLMWRDDHNFSSKDYGFVRKEAKRIKPIIAKYPGIKWYVSPVCEHRLTHAQWQEFSHIVLSELQSVSFTVVNSPEKTGKFPNCINEYHHRSGGDAFSYDGQSCFDSDVTKDKRDNANAEYFMLWCPQDNGRKKTSDTTPRPRRKAYCIDKHIKAKSYLAGEEGPAKLNADFYIGKSVSDQAHDQPQDKDCKPVFLTYLKSGIRPDRIVLKKSNKVVTTSKPRLSWDDEKNHKQIGWRWYFDKWGYEYNQGTLDVYANGKKIGTWNPGFREPER